MKSLLIIFSILLIACNQATTFTPVASDTSVTAITYIDKETKAGRLDLVYKVRKDTFSLDSISPGTYKQVPKRDSFYYVPVYVAVRDSTGQVIKDSTGKPVPYLEYRLLDKAYFLQDYNRRF